jgi:hypothetical protein
LDTLGNLVERDAGLGAEGIGGLGAGDDDVAAGATPYLRMMGLTLGGWLLARQAIAAGSHPDRGFADAKVATARFYAEQILPQATALAGPVMRGAALLYAIPEAGFAA